MVNNTYNIKRSTTLLILAVICRHTVWDSVVRPWQVEMAISSLVAKFVVIDWLVAMFGH